VLLNNCRFLLRIQVIEYLHHALTLLLSGVERHMRVRLQLRMRISTTRDDANSSLRLLEFLMFLVFIFSFLFHFHKVLEILPGDFFATRWRRPKLLLILLVVLHVDGVAGVVVEAAGGRVRPALESLGVLGDGGGNTVTFAGWA